MRRLRRAVGGGPGAAQRVPALVGGPVVGVLVGVVGLPGHAAEGPGDHADPPGAAGRGRDRGPAPPAAPAVPSAPETQQQAAARYAVLTCPAPPGPRDDAPAGYLAACSDDGQQKYLLGPAIVDDSDLRDAQARRQETTGAWVVEVSFDAHGARVWTAYTAADIGTQVAITVDGHVLSAPVIPGAIEGPTQISGTFTEQSARRLAQQLGGG